MQTLRTALVPGLIGGVISVITSWLWMGVIFHRYQRITPETWRPETSASFVLSSFLRLCAAVAIAAIYVLVLRFNVATFSGGMSGALRFGAIIWIALAAPIIIETAIYVRFHSMVVLAQALDWLTTSLVACAVTAWWIGK